MKFTVILGIMFSFLLIGCSKKTADNGCDKRIRVGNNNGIVFQNILDGEKRTKYGFDEIKFDLIDSPFAIISIPANEYDSIYFIAKITPEERSPYIWFTSYKNYSNFSISVGDSYDNLSVAAPLVNDQEKQYKVGIRGTFKEYSQENVVLICYSDETELSKNMTDKEKLETDGNSIYIIPYPWRKIEVKIEGGKSSDYKELIEWANKNVFNQAICSLKIAEEGNDDNYDCKILLGQKNISEDIVFLDETNNKYDQYRSNRVVSVKIKYGNLYETETQYEDGIEYEYTYDSPYKNKLLKKFAYAVARIMGVTEDNDPYFNLMTENDDNIDHIHLTFRQWNQLHMGE
jgi:hypothetical protein